MSVRKNLDGQWTIVDDYVPDDTDRKLRGYLARLEGGVSKLHARTGSWRPEDYEGFREEAQRGIEHAMKLWSETQRGAETPASSTVARAGIGGMVSRWWIRRAIEKARRRA